MTQSHAIVAVVEDEPEMRKALRRLLACRGFRVKEYEGGEAFLAALGSESLDCLLLDLHMVGLTGIEVLEALCIRKIPVPVIVITAHNEPGTAERARALGVSAYLKKPVDRDVLLSAIAEATAGIHKL